MPKTETEIIKELQRILRACHTHYPQQIAAGTITAPVAEHRQECLIAGIRIIEASLNSPPQHIPKPFPAQPLAKSVSELATPKQAVNPSLSLFLLPLRTP